jgi:hypothetical protein
MRRVLGTIALLALLTIVLGSCGEKIAVKSDPSLAEIMKIGRGYLRDGNGGSAAEAFQAAIRTSPNCDEAKYGLLIARNMQFFSLMDQLLTLISSMTASTTDDDTAAPQGGQVSSPDSIEPIGDYIQDFLRESAEGWYNDAEQLYLELLTFKDPHFEIDHFHMGITGLVEMDFGGRLDRTDLQYFGVFNALVRAIVNIALAHDLNFDFFSITIPTINIDLSDLTSPDGLKNFINSLQPIIDLLTSMLTFQANPDFLYLKGDEGVARMQAAGVELGQTFDRLHLLIEEAYRDTGPQTDGTVHYIDVNGTGRGDRHLDPLVLPGFGEFDADLVNGLDVLSSQTAQALWDDTPLDVDPYHPNPFYPAYANDLLTALKIFPLVIDKATLESLLSALGVTLPFPIGDNFQIVISGIPDNFLGIAIGPWFAQPAPDGVRQILWFVVDLYNTIKGFFPSGSRG